MNKEYIKSNSMLFVMIGFTAIIYGLGAFFAPSLMGWTLGILLGLIVSILKLKLMQNTFTNAVKMDEPKAKSYTQRHYMLRYLLTGIVLLIAAIETNISLIGVFVGLISMKIGAYVELGLKR